MDFKSKSIPILGNIEMTTLRSDLRFHSIQLQKKGNMPTAH